VHSKSRAHRSRYTWISGFVQVNEQTGTHGINRQLACEGLQSNNYNVKSFQFGPVLLYHLAGHNVYGHLCVLKWEQCILSGKCNKSALIVLVVNDLVCLAPHGAGWPAAIGPAGCVPLTART